MKYKIYYLTTEYDKYLPMYVGITSNKLSRRLGAHKSDSKKGNSKVHNWIKNRINQDYEILIELFEEVDEEGSFWENFYIDLCKSWGLPIKNLLYNEYNKYRTNRKGTMSDDAKIKMSKLFKDSKREKSHVELSIRNRLVEANKRGYYHSEETKQKISSAHIGKIVSEKERARLKEIRGNRRVNSSPVLTLNIKTNEVLYFDAITDFQRIYKIPHPNICKVLSGNRKHTGGFYFCRPESTCPIKIPLNGETPEVDNPVLSQSETIVNA